MEVAEWVGHRRLKAARTEMPYPRVISLRTAFGPAFRVFLRKPGVQVARVDKGKSLRLSWVIISQISFQISTSLYHRHGVQELD